MKMDWKKLLDNAWKDILKKEKEKGEQLSPYLIDYSNNIKKHLKIFLVLLNNQILVTTRISFLEVQFLDYLITDMLKDVFVFFRFFFQKKNDSDQTNSRSKSDVHHTTLHFA